MHSDREEPTIRETQKWGQASCSRASSGPSVSVVVPTYNRANRLLRVLKALGFQTLNCQQFQVVVISDGSTDGTDDAIRKLILPYELVYVTQPNSGPAAARNRGVGCASGELLVFLDDDVEPAEDLLEQHVLTHAAGSEQLVAFGPMLTPPGYRPSAFVRWEQAMLYKQYDAMLRGDFAPTYRQFFTGNASVRRALLLEAGGFDERYRRAEDIELAYRLQLRGARFVFNEKAIGYHYAERTFAAWLRIARAYGEIDVILDREGGRASELEVTRWEYRARHLATRSLTRACLGRSWLLRLSQWSIGTLVTTGDLLRLGRATTPMLSALYNATYYCGMADELGGRGAFRTLVHSSR